jgi:thiol-disulfide isomerase/thioredoxin
MNAGPFSPDVKRLLKGSVTMRFFNKYFFIGAASGVALTLLGEALLIGLAVFSVYTQWKNLRFDPGRVEASLPPPEFPGYDPRAPVYEQPGFPWAVRTLTGTEVALAQLKGKVVFLNFWATWCGPCVREMPSIERLHHSLQGEEVAFLLVSNEDKDTVRQFLEAKRFDLPVYLQTGEAPEVFMSQSIPATYILDRNGVLVFKHIGSANWDDESCRRFIRAFTQ